MKIEYVVFFFHGHNLDYIERWAAKHGQRVGHATMVRVAACQPTEKKKTLGARERNAEDRLLFADAIRTVEAQLGFRSRALNAAVSEQSTISGQKLAQEFQPSLRKRILGKRLDLVRK